MKTRIAVMVSGGGTNLQALIDAERAGRMEYGEIVLVISSRSDAFALERARAAGIEAVPVSRKECGGQEGFEARVTDLLEARGIDLIILAGFLTILSSDFVRRYDHRIINIHPSLIPSFCGDGFYGIIPHRAVLERGVKVTGATVHYVNEVPDGGEIISQKAVEVLEGDTPESLQRRVMEEAEWKLLPEAAAEISRRIAEEKAGGQSL